MRFCSVTFFFFKEFIQVCFRFTLKLKGRNTGVPVWASSPMTEFFTRIFVVQTGQYHPDSISSCCSFCIQYCAKFPHPLPIAPSQSVIFVKTSLFGLFQAMNTDMMIHTVCGLFTVISQSNFRFPSCLLLPLSSEEHRIVCLESGFLC